MSKVWFYLIILIILAIVGTGIYLMMADIPAPTERIIKIVPNELFPN